MRVDEQQVRAYVTIAAAVYEFVADGGPHGVPRNGLLAFMCIMGMSHAQYVMVEAALLDSAIIVRRGNNLIAEEHLS